MPLDIPSVTPSDEERLAQLGYTQVLARRMSAFSKLRGLLHDHLGPVGLPDAVSVRHEHRRPGRDHLGLGRPSA